MMDLFRGALALAWTIFVPGSSSGNTSPLLPSFFFSRAVIHPTPPPPPPPPPPHPPHPPQPPNPNGRLRIPPRVLAPQIFISIVAACNPWFPCGPDVLTFKWGHSEFEPFPLLSIMILAGLVVFHMPCLPKGAARVHP